ncbi:hypothetical protein BD779DRAFT_1671547 [Infundibulicybe gibba]|nr:hypothetical protein BD779DRAFT_1671547 [Infundibulicybe gibba]
MLQSTTTNLNELAISLARYLTVAHLEMMKRGGIIFCKTIDQAKDIGDTTGCLVSHSKLPDNLRSSNEKSWLAGKAQWIAATTGMIHGIDHPDCGAVIMLNQDFGLLDIYQAAGRGGRNGQPAWIFVINNSKKLKAPPTGNPDYQCIREGNAWLTNTTQCRRIGLSDLMDGCPVSCKDLPGSEHCDICNPQIPALDAIQRMIQQQKTTSKERAELGKSVPDINHKADHRPTIPMLKFSQPPSSSSSNGLPLAPSLAANHPPHTGPSINPNGLPLAPSRPSLTANHTSHTGPSISIQLDTAHYYDKIKMKEEYATIMDAMAKTLLGKCPVCFLLGGKTLTYPHKAFMGCGGQFFKDGYGWMHFKKDFIFKKYEYCFFCHFPQGDHLPACHVTHPATALVKCSHEDLVTILIWFIFRHSTTWTEFCSTPGLSKEMTLDEYSQWCRKIGVSGFFTGLEFVCQYWQKTQLTGK